MKIKICTKCDLEKNINEFHKFKHSKDGHKTICKICSSKTSKKYVKENKDKLKKYRHDNKEKRNEQNKKWREQNIERMRVLRKKYNNSEKGLEQKRKYYKETKNKNKHIIAWRTMLHNTIKRFGTKKENKTIIELGYSAIELREDMIKKFKTGMSWNNWGEWHIDHVKPVS